MLDEPTTGLHAAGIDLLMRQLHRLVMVAGSEWMSRLPASTTIGLSAATATPAGSLQHAQQDEEHPEHARDVQPLERVGRPRQRHGDDHHEQQEEEHPRDQREDLHNDREAEAEQDRTVERGPRQPVVVARRSRDLRGGPHGLGDGTRRSDDNGASP